MSATPSVTMLTTARTMLTTYRTDRVPATRRRVDVSLPLYKAGMVDLSIIIPVRNRTNGLRWTLQSLTEQRPPADVEVIVADDGSTEDAGAVVAAFEDRLDVRLLRDEVNQGRCVARNRGAAAASGERLLFLDGDSYTDPDLLARYRALHRERPDDVLLGRRLEIGWRSLNRLARDGRVATELRGGPPRSSRVDRGRRGRVRPDAVALLVHAQHGRTGRDVPCRRRL